MYVMAPPCLGQRVPLSQRYLIFVECLPRALQHELVMFLPMQVWGPQGF